MLSTLPCSAQTKKRPDTVRTGVFNNSTVRDAIGGGVPVFSIAKYKPEFTGGHAAMEAHFKKHIDLSRPLKNKVPSDTYAVSVLFTVWADGSIHRIHAGSSKGYGMEDEVMKALLASPPWKPARLSNNEIIAFATNQVVLFIVKGNSISIRVAKREA